MEIEITRFYKPTDPDSCDCETMDLECYLASVLPTSTDRFLKKLIERLVIQKIIGLDCLIEWFEAGDTHIKEV